MMFETWNWRQYSMLNDSWKTYFENMHCWISICFQKQNISTQRVSTTIRNFRLDEHWISTQMSLFNFSVSVVLSLILVITPAYPFHFLMKETKEYMWSFFDCISQNLWRLCIYIPTASCIWIQNHFINSDFIQSHFVKLKNVIYHSY